MLVTYPDGSQRRVVYDDADGHFALYPSSDTIAYGTDLEQTYAFERNSLGQMTARIDPLGRRTEYSLNSGWQVTGVTFLAGTEDAVSISVGYTAQGQVSSLTDPLGRTTTLSYTDGCLTRITNPLGHATTLECDADGKHRQVVDALSNVTLLHYEGFDLSGITDPMGRSVHLRHDPLGRLIGMEDALGNLSRREYDAEGRVVKLVDPAGRQTEVGYDPNGNVTAVLMPNGTGITWDYDERNRVVKRTDPLGQSESWTWDPMNRVKSHTDRNGQTTTFAYDVLGRLATTTYADGSVVTAAYDAGNRLLSLADTASGTLEWSYDNLDQVIGTQAPQGAITYEYDAAGRRTAMTVADQPRTEYQYDANNRLVRLLQGSEIVEFDYDALDRLTRMELPKGIQSGYAYTAASELAGIAWLKPDGSQLHTLGYGYDQAGRRVTQTGSLAPQALPTLTIEASVFDDNNRQLQYAGKVLSYDANGNLTGDGTRTYIWNARNQLSEIREGIRTIGNFSYDALGRRYVRIEDGVQTEYLYDGLDAVQELEDGQKIIPILTGPRIDQRFARGADEERQYFLTDGLRSARLISDGTANIVQRYDYDPYGEMQSDSVAIRNSYQYTGREKDESGLYYYRARYYSSAMGRFISEDPIGLAGGLNAYAYVRGNPISFIDPLGLVDLNLTHPNDGVHAGLNVIPRQSGIFSVGVHFDGETFYGPDSGPITAAELAELIKNAPGYSSQDLVQLYSCRAGASIDGRPPAAQSVATNLGNRVRASDQWTFIGPTQGYLGSYPKVDGLMDTSGPRGVWEVFEP